MSTSSGRDGLEQIDPDIRKRLSLDRLPTGRASRALGDLVDLSGTRVAVSGSGPLMVACCERFVTAGAEVALLTERIDDATSIPQLVAGRSGADPVPAEVCAGSWDQIRAAVDWAVAQLGAVDVWVNVTTGEPPDVEFRLQEPDDIAAAVASFVDGSVARARAVTDIMIDAGGGRIINVVSELGATPTGMVVYDACQATVSGLTRNLAYELPDHGITVVGVSAGVIVDDDMLGVLSSGDDEAQRARVERLERVLPRHLIGRFAWPEEVADVVVLLSSPVASYVHGTTVSVSGGLS